MTRLLRAIAAVLVVGAAAVGTTSVVSGAAAAAVAQHPVPLRDYIGDGAGTPVGGPEVDGTAPNLWLIVLDDATVADVEAMPAVGSLLADRGVTFTNGYVPFPECCPSRATLLSGRYPHNHGVLDSQLPYGGWTLFDDTATLATWLDAEYATALVGKYLNGYGTKGTETYVPPGWDRWLAPFGTSDVYDYLDRSLNVDGVLTPYPDVYSTTLYGDLTRDVVTEQAGGPDPFAVVTNFVANHAGSPDDPDDPDLPSPYVSERYRDTVEPSLPADPSIEEVDLADKPMYVQRRGPASADVLADVAEVHAQRQEALLAADDQIRLTLETLDARGELDSTYVVLLSDNGYMEGQHGISNGKNVPHQPAVRMPLIVRGPGIAPGQTVDALVAEQDIAPTILSLLGQERAHFGPPLDGQDLTPLLAGVGRGPDADVVSAIDRPVLIEIGSTEDEDARKTLRGVVTPDGWKYIDYLNSPLDEMYDLESDPYELENLFDQPGHAAQLSRLQEVLDAYRECVGAQCVRPLDGPGAAGPGR